MSTKTKSKPKPAPATVLTITLNTDGTGTLITQRGDLASLHSFTYNDLRGVIAAIQHGAAHLVAIESDPPVIPAETPPTPPPAATVEEPVPANEEADEAEPVPEDDGAEPSYPLPEAIPDHQPVTPTLPGVVANPASNQLSLF